MSGSSTGDIGEFVEYYEYSQNDFLKSVQESISEPWTYIGAVADMSQVFSQSANNVFDEIAQLANEVRNGLAICINTRERISLWF